MGLPPHMRNTLRYIYQVQIDIIIYQIYQLVVRASISFFGRGTFFKTDLYLLNPRATLASLLSLSVCAVTTLVMSLTYYSASSFETIFYHDYVIEKSVLW